MSVGAEAQREVERKYDVPDGWQLPGLQSLVPGGSIVEEPVSLVSTYYDTAARHLLGTRLTLRRRTGDIDTGWQLKVPDGDARIELHWPLTNGRGVPADIRDVTLGVRGRAALAPVATLAVERRISRLLDADGEALAEVVLDTVTATRADGTAAPDTWREVEVELVGGGRKLLERTGRLLRESGASRSASTSKLGRALGRAPSVDHGEGTLAGVVAGYLDLQWEAIVRGDLDLRRGERPVHVTRTAIRRYRSVLRVFAPVLDAARADALDARLRTFAGTLGEVRDNEVLHDTLASLVATLPPGQAAGAAADVIDAELSREQEAADAAVDTYLRSRGHLGLLAELCAWHAELPIDHDAPASEAARFVRRADKKARRRFDLATSGDHVPAGEVHGARKAAKRARYVAELAVGAGRALSRTQREHAEEVRTRHKRVQQRLGDQQDSAVAAQFLARVGQRAADPSVAFTLGVLHERAEWGSLG